MSQIEDAERTDEQRALREGLAEMLRALSSVRPFRSWLNDENGVDLEVWQEVGAAGWLGVAEAPDDGPDVDVLSAATLAYLCEEIGAHLLPGPFSLTAALIVPFLSRVAHPELDLRSIIEGRTLATIVLPTSGTPLAPRWPEICQVEERDGGVHLRGRASGVPVAQHADVLLVPFEGRGGQIRVAALPSGYEGVGIEEPFALDLSTPTATVVVDVWVDDAQLLGAPDQNHCDLLSRWLIRYLLCLDGESVGAADMAVRQTVTYVSERHQFGVPVGSFQAVKHMVANAYGSVELARGLLHDVATRAETAVTDADVASAHLVASRMYRTTVEICIQAQGGMGFTYEHGLHLWYRQAMFYANHPFRRNDLQRIVWSELVAVSGLGDRVESASNS